MEGGLGDEGWGRGRRTVMLCSAISIAYAWLSPRTAHLVAE